MKFSKVVFLVAGIWGVLIVTPLFFLFDYIGSIYPPALTHPDIYYGFVTVTLAWQFAFLIIARDPARYRPLLPAILVEKFAYVAALVVLYSQGRIQFGQTFGGIPDFFLGLLFIAAYVKTREDAVAPNGRT